MTSDASASGQASRDRIGEGGFAVALSGGGHRATLATLGAVLAIIDRGLGPKIMQVAGVSGGSITNAFVAQRCRLDELSPGGLDSVATELAATIIRKGVLTRSWIALLLLIPVILGFVAGTVVELRGADHSYCRLGSCVSLHYIRNRRWLRCLRERDAARRELDTNRRILAELSLRVDGISSFERLHSHWR